MTSHLPKAYDPQDIFFHQLMASPSMMESFFRAHVPNNIKNHINFSAIEQAKSGRLLEQLSWRRAGMIYQTQMSLYPHNVYFMVEAISETSDNLFDYCTWDDRFQTILDAQRKATKEHWPLLFYFVLYVGDTPFDRQDKRIFNQCLLKLLPFDDMFTYGLQTRIIDVKKINDRDLLAYDRIGQVYAMLQHVQDNNVEQWIETTLLPWMTQPIPDNCSISPWSLLEYLLRVSNHICPDRLLTLIDQHKSLPIKAKENMVTFVEYIERRGIEKGLQQGISRGKERGIVEGKLVQASQTIKQCSDMGLSTQDAAKLTGLPEAIIDSLIE